MKKKLLPIFWFSALGGVVVLTSEIHGESTKFYGIADDQEQTVRFNTAVEITKIHYIDGQNVSLGDLILEVRRPELYSERAIIEDKINEITSLDREETSLLRARLASLKEDLQAKLADLDARIFSLRSRHQWNVKILRQLSEQNPKSINPGSSPLLAEMTSLQKQRKHVQSAIQAEIDSLVEKLNASVRPVDSQISSLNERKSELARQQTVLRVTANISGQIGNSFYKPGDIVPPYQPVLTVYPDTPGFVKGYIHENVVNSVKPGQRVWLTTTSNAARPTTIEGNIESLGSRIVEYPDRLKKTPLVNAWGREVVIRLSPNHSLLSGEKVEVAMKQPHSITRQLGAIKQKLEPSWRYLADLFDGAGMSLADEYVPTRTQNSQLSSASKSMPGRTRFTPSI